MTIKKDRVLITEASDSLNFLLYVHNYAQSEKHMYPYLPSNPWKLQEQAVLKPLLRQLWNASLTSSTYPSLPIDLQKENFRPIFKDEKSFESCLDTFYSWWGSMAGKMAVERFADQDHLHSLYTLFLLSDKEELTIHFLYENIILGRPATSDQLVLTLRETFIQEEMIRTVQERLSL
ncbi:hypothetical protein SAMN05421663_101370 [Terribacillus halophilus]|uniref:Uncharacterized protein n=1 Tax=Terribacillus halophilus TaxID=361279 RepID=A0A1G6IS28_9BACI|nr:hypothetical protein [Terribacillus halophilus]SDC09288.1 hypothetical protein SAMN05421663_101370 [Terribacillus halophilus]